MRFAQRSGYSLTVRNRSAFAITETELKLIAAPAIIGLRRMPKQRIKDTGGDRHAERVVDEREEIDSAGYFASPRD